MSKLKFIHAKSSASMRVKNPFSKIEQSPISITLPDKFIFLEGKEKDGRFSVDSIGVYDVPVENSSMKKGNLFNLNLPNAHYCFYGEVKKDDIRISRSIGKDVFVSPSKAKKWGKEVKVDWSDLDKSKSTTKASTSPKMRIKQKTNKKQRRK